MTEEEAKTRWCPMVKVFAVVEDEYLGRKKLLNQIRNDSGNNCIGSACMMWRWHWSETRINEKGQKQWCDPYRTDSGYCGLAGKTH